MQSSQELEKECESIQKLVKNTIQEEIQKINQQIVQKNGKIDRLMEITIALEKQSKYNKVLEELNLEIKDELEQVKVELQKKCFIIQQKESELVSAFEQNEALQNDFKSLDDACKIKDQEIEQITREINNLN